MTTRADYTVEEWTLLLQAPANAATYLITADMSVIGALKELKAMGKAVEQREVAPAAQELVNALVADLEEISKNKESVEAPEIQEGEEARAAIRQGLQKSADLLDTKCSAEEAAGFRQWLLTVAQAVAEADKEGSHFGIGGVRVTEKEEAALAEIRSTFGL